MVIYVLQMYIFGNKIGVPYIFSQCDLFILIFCYKYTKKYPSDVFVISSPHLVIAELQLYVLRYIVRLYVHRSTLKIYNYQAMSTWGPFSWHGLTLIPVWITNYMHYKMWNEITSPFPDFNVTPLKFGMDT